MMTSMNANPISDERIAAAAIKSLVTNIITREPISSVTDEISVPMLLFII